MGGGPLDDFQGDAHTNAVMFKEFQRRAAEPAKPWYDPWKSVPLLVTSVFWPHHQLQKGRGEESPPTWWVRRPRPALLPAPHLTPPPGPVATGVESLGLLRGACPVGPPGSRRATREELGGDPKGNCGCQQAVPSCELKRKEGQ